MASGDSLGMVQIAYPAEWALSKYFGAVVDKAIMERYRLMGVCGREQTIEQAIARLSVDIHKRNIDAASTSSEKRNVDAQNENARHLVRMLQEGEVQYFAITQPDQIPERAYELADVVVIHALNTLHINYIREAVERGKHIICEKPLVETLNDKGMPVRGQFNELERILQSPEVAGLTMIDAEHYSYKSGSLTFYENISHIIGDAKIVRIYGEVMEIDDPNHPRTQSILSPKNGTGLMGDTMCHLLAFVSNLGGTAKPVSREYSKFVGDIDGKHVEYIVDTYDKVEFEVDGMQHAEKGIKAEFKVGKFIKYMNPPLENPSKYIRFDLSDGSNVTVNFGKGTVIKEDKDHKQTRFFPNYPISGNEYVPILHGVFHAIKNGHQMRTSMIGSMRTLGSIIGAYELGGGIDCDINRDVKIYERPVK